jgi:hypothetical protein
LLFHSAELFAEKVDLRNYVIGKYNANTNEVRVARQRAILYWQKNGPRIGEKGHYLAIDAAAVMGYISVDTPGRGKVARFGSYLTRYIGWG